MTEIEIFSTEKGKKTILFIYYHMLSNVNSSGQEKELSRLWEGGSTRGRCLHSMVISVQS